MLKNQIKKSYRIFLRPLSMALPLLPCWPIAKQKAHLKNLAEFEVFQTDDRGAVGVRVKAKIKTIYKWQYCNTNSIYKLVQ